MILETLVPLIVLIALLLAGVPVGFSLAISGTFGLFLVVDISSIPVLLVNDTYQSTASYLLSTIPMFILMAEFLREGGLTEKIFTAANRWLSGVRGGLAMATALASGGMAALSGSSTATAATMSNVAVPEMKKYGYGDRISLGTVSAAGTFAVMIPPSLALIIYGILTETSISALFIAGIVPGLLTVVGYGLTIVVWGRMNPSEVGGTPQQYTTREKFGSLSGIWPAVVIVALVLGGLYLGVVTPTEAGALGAAGTMVVAVLVGGMRFSGTRNALQRAAETTAMIFIIVIGAMIFSRFLTFSGALDTFVDTLTDLPVDRRVILLLILAMYVAMGTVMDQLAILILTLPVVFPLMVELGYGPVWFGIVLTKTIEVGLVTPPLGMNVYIAAGTVDMDVATGFRGAMRFLPVDFVIITLLILFPEIATFLVPA